MCEFKKTFPLNLRALYVVCAAVFLIISCHAKPNAANSAMTDSIVAAPTPTAGKIASKVKFSSVFTKLDSKTCKPFAKPASEEDEVPDICDGYRDYKVFVSHHGAATQIYIGRDIPTGTAAWDASELPSFIANGAGAGQTIEWRLADGEPFACIVRAEYDKSIINPDEKGAANELVIKNLKGFVPISITIDAKKNKRANQEAQRRADAGYGKL